MSTSEALGAVQTPPLLLTLTLAIQFPASKSKIWGVRNEGGGAAFAVTAQTLAVVRTYHLKDHKPWQEGCSVQSWGHWFFPAPPLSPPR